MNHSHKDDSLSVIFSIFSLFGLPRRMVDFGCGTAVMVRAARTLGVKAVGVDLVAEDEEDVRHDLTRPLDMGKVFDMILCLETAEHLPEEAAWTLGETINAHRHPNSLLIFSAALPGQDGEGHVNLKPPVWWRELLYETGKWSYRKEATTELQLILRLTAGPLANWLVPNVQVF